MPSPSGLHCLDIIAETAQFPIQIVLGIQLLVCFIDLHSSHQQFLVPLLIEKLDSDVQNAKVDSLQTLVKHHSDTNPAWLSFEWWDGDGFWCKGCENN